MLRSATYRCPASCSSHNHPACLASKSGYAAPTSLICCTYCGLSESSNIQQKSRYQNQETRTTPLKEKKTKQNKKSTAVEKVNNKLQPTDRINKRLMYVFLRKDCESHESLRAHCFGRGSCVALSLQKHSFQFR